MNSIHMNILISVHMNILNSELLIFRSFESVMLWGGFENLSSLYAYFLLSYNIKLNVSFVT